MHRVNLGKTVFCKYDSLKEGNDISRTELNLQSLYNKLILNINKVDFGNSG